MIDNVPSPAPELSRLVMVATSAWELPPESNPQRIAEGHESSRQGHGALLRHLLAADADGEAWIGRDNDGKVAYCRHGSTDADQLIRELEDDVKRVCAEARDRVDRSRSERRRLLHTLRHRIVLDPIRFCAATRSILTNTSIVGEAAGAGNQPVVNLIALDLRFDFYQDTPSCHLSLSVWSARPLHDRYAPIGWPCKGDRPIPVAHLRQYVDRYHTILRQMITLLERFLIEVEFRVYRRKNVLPIFWVPVPKNPAPDADDYRCKESMLRRQLATTFLGLGDPTDCVAVGSVVNGQFDVLRRFRRGLRGELQEGKKHLTLSRAHYLIIPAEPPDAASAIKRRDRLRAIQEQEDRAADVITRLTDLEALGASSLHEVHRDLRIWRNHLDVYDQVVERGAFLWDGLSTHLVTRRRRLRRVHHAVELLHQILLQGVGDLAYLSNRIRDSVARIEDATERLHAEYDDYLTERHPEQTNGLRSALARTGLFERVIVHGHHTLQEADRVKAIYDDLLRTIGYAFDEWRVRESDVAQRLSAALGVFLALIGIVTVLDATVTLKPTSPGATIIGGGTAATNLAVWASWVIGGGLLLAVGVLLWAWTRSGRLGSSRFRRLYFGRHDGAWQLLKDISSNKLDSEAYDCGNNMMAWAYLDDRLATRFADLWDQTSAMCDTNRHNQLSTDIEAQTRRIEQWGLHALLLTERARRMHRYVLPRLTCLYRACTRLPGSFLAGPGQAGGAASGRDIAEPNPADTPTMIDFNEFALSLKHIGLNWNEAYQLELWLLNRRPQSARHLLALVSSLGLTADMKRTGSMLDQIQRDLGQHRLPEYPKAFTEDIRRHFEHKQYTAWKVDADDGHTIKVTAKHNEQTCVIHAWPTRTPSVRDIGQLLRDRRHKRILATTGTIRPLTNFAARLTGVETIPMGWSATTPRQRTGPHRRGWGQTPW